jgi:hypothetical protein
LRTRFKRSTTTEDMPNNCRFKRKPTIADNKVVNLSHITLTSAQLSVLQKGLSFCPTSYTTDTIARKQDALEFGRKIQLLHHFRDQPEREEDTETPSTFHTPSGWTPYGGKNQVLDQFIATIQNRIDLLPTRTTAKTTLPRNNTKQWKN